MMKKLILFTLILVFETRAQATVVHASSFGWNKEDATNAFRAAINSFADTIIIDKQESDWVVGPNTFSDLHDKTLIFEHGVILRAKPNAFIYNWNCLLELIRAKNIKIMGYGATFQMNKVEYAALNDGEGRHSISIINSSNVRVYGLRLNESGGDGVYINGDFGYGEQLYSEYIYLKDLWCDNHYRQGISVTSAQHLYVQNCWFTNTSGTLPTCGVDLEPNHDSQRLVDVVFDKCKFTGNAGNGILLSFQHLNNSSIPVEITFQNCYLSGNHDVSNKSAAAEINIGTATREAVTGIAKFTHCMVENIQWTAVKIRKPADSFLASFDNCVFLNVSQDRTNFFNTPFWIEVTDYYNPCPRFGGAVFNDCLLSYSTPLHLLGSFGDGTTSLGMGKVQLNNLTVINPNSSVTINVTEGGGSPDTTCKFDYNKFTTTASTTLDFTSENRLIKSANKYSRVKVSRKTENVSFPVGITYSLGGTAIQGEDYCLTNGFMIIPAFLFNQVDTVFVFRDEYRVEPKNIVVSPKTNQLFTTTSSPQIIEILGCIINLDSVKFIVFPNPAKDYIEIKLKDEYTGVIRVINEMGQLVLLQKGQGKITRLNTQGLWDGLFFISINLGARWYAQKFIIKRN